MCAEFKKRRDVMVAGLNKIKGFSCRLPKGAFYVFPNITKTGWRSKKLADALLDEGRRLDGRPCHHPRVVTRAYRANRFSAAVTSGRRRQRARRSPVKCASTLKHPSMSPRVTRSP